MRRLHPPLKSAPRKAQQPTWAGLRDEELKRALKNDASRHVCLGLNTAYEAVFTKVDRHGGRLACVYTGRILEADGVPENRDMNLEHVWPKSKGAKKGAARSDLHNLLPADSDANSHRQSYPFGEVKKVIWEKDGAKFGFDSVGQKVFEPPDDKKGDVARALFYFATAYGFEIPARQEQMLRKWASQDPVDDFERERNDEAERWQGNRNWFVDFPKLHRRIKDF